MDDRHRLMAEVEAAQTALARLLLTDQLLPVLNSPLTMQQLRFMALLYRDGPTPGHRLAAQLNVSMPTVSGTVDRLVEHGMIARRVDDRDRRVRLVELTPAGEQMLTSFQEAGWRMGREVMAGQGRCERGQLGLGDDQRRGQAECARIRGIEDEASLERGGDHGRRD
ncbi:MAG TPA: MarR family transcriptional regulator, partial [Actinomycetaceae bacterium]|nr:MarR family transcriptional regulator [Actinomycetaceae bacterium]